MTTKITEKKTLLKINIVDAMRLIRMVLLFYFKTLYLESAPSKMSLYTQSLVKKINEFFKIDPLNFWELPFLQKKLVQR